MILSHFHPVIGGAEIQAQRIGESLTQKGYGVTVLTPRYRGLKSREDINGIIVRRLPVFGRGRMIFLSFICACIFYVWRHRREIDMLQAHQLAGPGLIACLAGKFFAKPVIARIEGGSQNGSEIKMLAKKPLGLLRIKFLKINTSCFISVSRAIEKELCEFGIHNVFLIPNGVDTNKFSVSTDREKVNLRNQLGLPPDKVIFTYAGRLEYVKGVDILLQSWQMLSAGARNAVLLVVLGDGAFKKSVESAALSENIIYRGTVENICQYLQASDVFIIPSRYEGSCVALLEAMSCSLAVLASRVGGNCDIINEDNGVLFEPERCIELAGWIERLCDDQDLRLKLGRKAKAAVADNYSLDQVVQRHESIYKTINAHRQYKG
jgi:glycosyltransferase involved in cell wall biosynthesis